MKITDFRRTYESTHMATEHICNVWERVGSGKTSFQFTIWKEGTLKFEFTVGGKLDLKELRKFLNEVLAEEDKRNEKT